MAEQQVSTCSRGGGARNDNNSIRRGGGFLGLNPGLNQGRTSSVVRAGIPANYASPEKINE